MSIQSLTGDSGNAYEFQALEINNSSNEVPPPPQAPGIYAFARTLGEIPAIICIEEAEDLQVAIAESVQNSCVKEQDPKFVLIYVYRGAHGRQADVRDVGTRQHVVKDLKIAYPPPC